MAERELGPMGPVELGVPLVVPPEAYNTLKVELAKAAGICAGVARISQPAAVERLQLLEQALARCQAAVGTFEAMSSLRVIHETEDKIELVVEDAEDRHG